MSAEKLYLSSPAWLQTLMLNAYAVRINRHRYGDRYQKATEKLLESQYWTRERLREHQDGLLRSLIRTAYSRSPYYRRLMNSAGITPEEIRGVGDLPKLPILTRELVREFESQLLTGKPGERGWLHGHTSGTTGSPLSIWYDRQTCVMNNAADRRQKVWGGMRRGDWIGVFLGRMVVPADEARPPFWRTNLVHRQVWFSSFHLTPENMTSYVAEIRRRRLRFLEGYPSTLFILAQHLIATGETLPMEAVFSSSETLHQVQLEAILAAFGCTPFDFYGHAERAIFATECELHEGKHLAEEYGFAEIVNEEGTSLPDGEFGYLTGTSLFNIAMPMIRYRTTDISAIMHEPCKCGRSLRRIENISTKAEDIVVTPDGRMISPSVLTHPFKPFPQIVASQLVQERADRLVVKIIPSDRFTPENQAELLRSLGARLGPAVQLDLQIVEDIPRERSGKFRWVISHVAHPSVFQWEQPG